MARSEQQTEIPLDTYRVTINYIAKNGMVRSTSLAIEAPDTDTAKKSALKICETQDWKKPKITSVKLW